MRPPGSTLILLTVGCALCAAAIAALPGPGAPRGNSADAAKIVSALSIVPRAVISWEKTAREKTAKEKAAEEKTAGERAGKTGREARARAAACSPVVTLPGLGLGLGPGLGLEPAEPAACPAASPGPSPGLEKSAAESG